MFDFLVGFLKFAAGVTMQVGREMKFDKPSSEDLKHRTQNIHAGIMELALKDGTIIYQAVVHCGDAHWHKEYTTVKTAEMGKDILVDVARASLNV